MRLRRVARRRFVEIGEWDADIRRVGNEGEGDGERVMSVEANDEVSVVDAEFEGEVDLEQESVSTSSDSRVDCKRVSSLFRVRVRALLDLRGMHTENRGLG